MESNLLFLFSDYRVRLFFVLRFKLDLDAMKPPFMLS